MKIGFIGGLPPASIFPPEVIRPRYRKAAHPAPWMVALLPALGEIGGYKLRVFITHRAIQESCVVEHGGVEYEGVPSLIPERFGKKTLYHQYSMPVGKAVRKYAPDLVHAFGFETGSALIALRTGVPVSCFIQGIAEDYFPYYGSRGWVDRNVARWGESRAVGRVPWMVAETEYAREWALRRNPGAHVALIPHPLRGVFLERAAPSHAPSVLSVGSLDDRKGMDVVIKAFARVKNPEARLTLVGGGPLRSNLEELVNILGVGGKVEFTGPMDTDRVIERMNAAGVFVIASRVDTSPNVLSEAHAIGLPVIGTRGGGIPEMIDHGVDGYTVDVDDDESMAEKMELLLADSDLSRRMGKAGREKVRVLNAPRRIAEAHVEFFDKIRRDIGC